MLPINMHKMYKFLLWLSDRHIGYHFDSLGNLAAYRFAKPCFVEQVVAYSVRRPAQIWKHGALKTAVLGFTRYSAHRSGPSLK